MCTIVIAGGPNIDITPLLDEVKHARKIVCADSGADSLAAHSILPDMVWGDMDSISSETLSWLKENHIDNRVFPVEKDMTDSELCLRAQEKGERILFITSLTGRIDHVMTNLLMVMRLKMEGYDITVTDGATWIFPLYGMNRFMVPDELVGSEKVFSMILLEKGATNVSTIGLKYELTNRDLAWGSSLTVSNEFDMDKKEHGIVMENGTMLVVVTPRS